MEQTEHLTKLLISINEIERLLTKYHVTAHLPEVSECKILLRAKKYQEVLSRINSSRWWGEYSIADVYLTSANLDEISKDMAIYEENLLRIAYILEDAGICNEDAHEIIFQLSSWGYKVE